MAYLDTLDSGSIKPTNVDDVYGAALQYGRLLIGGPNFQTHYDVFDKDFLEFGAMIADYKIIPNESTEVNPKSGTFTAPKYNEILKLYFGDWHDRSYETSVRDSEAYAVVNGQTSLDVFISQIVNSINEQEKLEKYQNYNKVFESLMKMEEPTPDGFVGELKNLNQYETLNFGSATDSKYVDGATKEFTEEAYQAVFREIRNVVDRMTFPSGENSGGYNSAASLDDIYICAPLEFWNGGGVMWLAQAYHLEEAQVMGHIVKTNVGQYRYTEGAPFGYTIFILHKRAIGRCVRYRNSMEQFVRQSWSRWFGQELVDLYYFNKYEKAWAINMIAEA